MILMWNARTKSELIIEVWEKLDCENVGRAEIEAIETAVASHFGRSAVDSPMALARLLADEGAELRHAEIMELFVIRSSNRPYDAALRSITKLESLRSALSTIRDLENLRKKYRKDGDKDGLRELRETARRGKNEVDEIAASKKTEAVERQVAMEITQWLSLWLQTPELFESWIAIRQDTPEFKELFGDIRPE
ncbi:MAG: hypothetical protein WBO68_10165 [Pyrinomonadaceae bacterium]